MLLWLHGKPGCGKTVLSSTIVDDVSSCLAETAVLAYYFFSFDDEKKQKSDKLLCSLVLQLFDQRVNAPTELISLYDACEGGSRQPDIDNLVQILGKMIDDAGDVYIIIDALDECSDVHKLLQIIGQIRAWQQPNLHILLTSRRHKETEDRLEILTQTEGRVTIENALVDADISVYVRERLQNDTLLKRWRNNPYVREEIRYALTEKADGMYVHPRMFSSLSDID